MVAAFEELEEEKRSLSHRWESENSRTSRSEGQTGALVSHAKHTQLSRNTTFGTIWKQLLALSVDPHPDIAQDAAVIVDYIHLTLLESPMAPLANKLQNEVLEITGLTKFQPRERTEAKKTAPPPTPPLSGTAPSKQEGYLSLSFRRTASVAASLKNLAFGNSATGDPSSDNSNPPSPSTSRMTITPRGRAPPEWTRPPEGNDHVAPATAYHQAPIPTSRGFQPKGFGVVPVIPLKSRFLDWSTEVIPDFESIESHHYRYLHLLTISKYFREPQMKPNEPDEPGSSDYNQRLWRRGRNEKIIAETQPLKGKAGASRWDNSVALLSNGSQPHKMCFHQFEDHIAVADDRDTIA